jgi:hypothetical protein
MPRPTGRCVRPEGGIEELGKLRLWLSLLRPKCPADECIFCWQGARPRRTGAYLGNPVLRYLVDRASAALLRDAGSYGSGLRKFHIFCDIFSVPEPNRLPAGADLLRAFALLAVANPGPNDIALTRDVVF